MALGLREQLFRRVVEGAQVGGLGGDSSGLGGQFLIMMAAVAFREIKQVGLPRSEFDWSSEVTETWEVAPPETEKKREAREAGGEKIGTPRRPKLADSGGKECLSMGA